MADRFNLLDFHYAHRGLWSEDGFAENSLGAFNAASELGYGIELDVRPSSDNVPVVFHDPLLDRLTQETGLVSERSAGELTTISLSNGGPIPSLNTVLKTVAGAVPVLIELKIDGETCPIALTKAVVDELNQYDGPAALMSFSTDVVNAVPTALMSGQVIFPGNSFDDSDCDFVAINRIDALDQLELTALPAIPITVWTVNSAEEAILFTTAGFSLTFEAIKPLRPLDTRSDYG